MHILLQHVSLHRLIILSLLVLAFGFFSQPPTASALVDPGDVPGCTDVSATNYNPLAIIDDGSCIVPGCIDASANNYNESATVDDSSCTYDVSGCTDADAVNYNPAANDDDGSCGYHGCTDPTASNYDEAALADDGSCYVSGCTNPLAGNYNPLATTDDASCVISGCTDPAATNYNPSATESGASCEYVVTDVSPTCSLTANPDTITSGESATLTWSTTNAQTLAFSSGVTSTSLDGTVVVAPAQTTTYTVTASTSASSTNTTLVAQSEVTCSATVTVHSVVTSSGGGGGGGGSSSSGSRTSDEPEPEVLGVSTSSSEAPACGPLLSTYMRQGSVNQTAEVFKLQVFLTVIGFDTPLTGVFDTRTTISVMQFQTRYAAEILQPWVDIGLLPDLTPNGYVYRTTRWKINDLYCPGSEGSPLVS